MKPWITPGLKKSTQIKNRYYRNKLNHLLKICKKQYYNAYFARNIANSKNIWKGIRQITNIKQHPVHKSTTLLTDNQVISDPKLVAHTFNQYFANICSNLAETIPNVSNSLLDYLGGSPVDSSFVFYPITQREIENEISLLKVSKATGPHSIPTDVMQILESLISKPLEIIFNLSLVNGCVPNQFKLAKGPFIIYTSGGHRREIKKSIYKKITQPLWVFKFFLPNL